MVSCGWHFVILLGKVAYRILNAVVKWPAFSENWVDKDECSRWDVDNGRNRGCVPMYHSSLA